MFYSRRNSQEKNYSYLTSRESYLQLNKPSELVELKIKIKELEQENKSIYKEYMKISGKYITLSEQYLKFFNEKQYKNTENNFEKSKQKIIQLLSSSKKEKEKEKDKTKDKIMKIFLEVRKEINNYKQEVEIELKKYEKSMNDIMTGIQDQLVHNNKQSTLINLVNIFINHFIQSGENNKLEQIIGEIEKLESEDKDNILSEVLQKMQQKLLD